MKKILILLTLVTSLISCSDTKIENKIEQTVTLESGDPLDDIEFSYPEHLGDDRIPTIYYTLDTNYVPLKSYYKLVTRVTIVNDKKVDTLSLSVDTGEYKDILSKKCKRYSEAKKTLEELKKLQNNNCN